MRTAEEMYIYTVEKGYAEWYRKKSDMKELQFASELLEPGEQVVMCVVADEGYEITEKKYKKPYKETYDLVASISFFEEYSPASIAA